MAAKYSVSAGICASLGAVFSKLAFGDNFAGFQYVPYAQVLLRTLFLALFVVANVLLWNVFPKALSLHSSSLQPVIVSTAVNFALSGLLAVLVFGESYGLQWWCGIGLILIGVIYVSA